MLEKEAYLKFSYLKIQLRSSIEAEVKGPGDLFVNSKYVRFVADNRQSGCHQCGFVPWDMISYISYDRV